MLTLQLKDGTALTDLEINGDYYVAAAELDRDIFSKENLAWVKVTDEDTGTELILTDAVLLDFRIVKEHTFFAVYEKTQQEKEHEQLTDTTAAAAIAFVVMAEAGTIDEVTATEHIGMFAPWASGVHYSAGALRCHGGILYRCVQEHTSQDDWTPDTAVSLWTEAGDPGEEYPAWSQPVGAYDAYAAGDKVSHNDTKWISDVDSNVWEPGVYGWTEEGGTVNE